MSLLERMARQLEADAVEIVEELRDAGRKGDWRATEALLTRVYGRPVERVEQVESVDVRSMTPEQRRALMARVLDENPGLAELVPRTARVQPDAQTRMATGDSG